MSHTQALARRINKLTDQVNQQRGSRCAVILYREIPWAFLPEQTNGKPLEDAISFQEINKGLYLYSYDHSVPDIEEQVSARMDAIQASLHVSYLKTIHLT